MNFFIFFSPFFFYFIPQNMSRKGVSIKGKIPKATFKNDLNGVSGAWSEVGGVFYKGCPTIH
jgi:hypothetical protein